MGHHYYNPARYTPSSLARRPCKPQTVERQHLRAKFHLVPDADLAIGSNGAWQWARSRPDLEEFFANYFADRAECGLGAAYLENRF